MAILPLDEDRLREALVLAERAIGLSEPNPRVGCVLANARGQVVGRGFTQRIGQAHAEVIALRDAQAHGADVRGGTAWVTLEPCAHHGRTPPCCDALVDAGLARVVVAMVDPFPAVAGAGIARLRAAGIEVEVADGELATAARELNVGFLSRIERGRPWVRLKLAASLDGLTALPDGRSQWITGPQARADGHAWRRRAGAVLTGIGTILTDDPRLDVRLVPTDVQPLRVVLDTQGRMPANARITQPPGSVLVLTAIPRASAHGPTTEPLPTAAGRLDLKAVLARLTQLAVNELHVEAGAELSGAFLADGLVDELLIYLAPRLLGQGRAMASMSLALTLDSAPDWVHLDQALVGPDLRLRLRHKMSEYFTKPTRPD